MFAQAAGAHERRERITMAPYRTQSLVVRAERTLLSEMSDEERMMRKCIGDSLCWKDLLISFLEVGLTHRLILHEPNRGCMCTEAVVHPPPPPPPPPPAPHVKYTQPDSTIILSVSYGNDLNQITQFKIKKTTPLRKMKAAYCSRWSLQDSQVRLMVAFNKLWLESDDSAEKVGLEDGDLITAFTMHGSL